VETFEAEVLPGNKSMLAVFARSGLPMTQKPGDGVIHVTMALTAATP
jgi:precorrin-2 methylase